MIKVFGVVILVIGLFAVVFGIARFGEDQTPQQRAYSTVSFGEAVLRTEVVDDDASRQRGLSGRESMADDTSMLFVFEQPGIECFWMKDMHFAIDMIWLDEVQRVTHIAHNVAPETYPQNFCPQKDSKYVLEVVAGTARKIGLHEGAKLEFNL